MKFSKKIPDWKVVFEPSYLFALKAWRLHQSQLSDEEIPHSLVLKIISCWCVWVAQSIVPQRWYSELMGRIIFWKTTANQLWFCDSKCLLIFHFDRGSQKLPLLNVLNMRRYIRLISFYDEPKRGWSSTCLENLPFDIRYKRHSKALCWFYCVALTDKIKSIVRLFVVSVQSNPNSSRTNDLLTIPTGPINNS